jgi:serine/threonine protein kinase
LEGIKYLHSLNIIHRDIKLENILIKDDKVKISDFGLAKQMGNKLWVESMKCGTPCTMAPEIYFADNSNACHKKPLYNNKCDIWSIGVVLHELAYKKHPFGYDFELFRKGRRIKLDNPIHAIEKIINRCLVMDSRDRADISELVDMANEYPFESPKLVN